MNIYLEKLAELSSDTKKELAQTGVMAAAGGATGYLGHKLMQTSTMKGMKIPEGGKAALAVGGLGLLGDYAAVKLNRHIEKKAGVKDLVSKILSAFDKKKPVTFLERSNAKSHARYAEENNPLKLTSSLPPSGTKFKDKR